jgi:acetylornithine/succinyldiaminopimelate/putrescine aminotransferase
VPGFKYVPFNDLGALELAVTPATCAVMLEPIQGEGGVNVPSEDYLARTRELCDEKGLLLIFDEVQTGLGRTGNLFCYENYGVAPDIMTLAKSLAGGTAMGAMLAREEVAASFVPGTHASTFGGNPLAAAAGVAAVSAIIEENLLDNCREVGAYLMSELRELQKKYTFIKEVRGSGLLIGMELDFEGMDIVNDCMSRGFLINCTVGNVLRFMPPLIVKMEEANLMLKCLKEVLKKV